MIKPLDVELKIIFSIILFGIYFSSTIDIINYVEKKYNLKIWVRIIIELINLIFQIFITFEFCFNLDNGYIPIYFFLFLLIGFLLYYIFMKEYNLKLIAYLFKKVPLLLHLLYSKTIFSLIKIRIQKVLNRIKIKIKTKKEKKDETEIKILDTDLKI